jgi:hypothetical protein
MRSAIKVAEAADYEAEMRWDHVISSIEGAGILPASRDAIPQSLELYRSGILGCVADNIPDILLLYVTALARQYALLKSTSSSTSSLQHRPYTSADILQAQPPPGNLREKADIIVTFAGLLPPEAVAHIQMELIKFLSTMA